MRTIHRSFPISSFYLLLTAVIIAVAATVPRPQTQPQLQQQDQPEINLTSLQPSSPYYIHKSGEAHCATTIPLSPFWLRLHHCIDAIRGLSNDADNGLFHMADPFDAFSLPVIKTKQYCEVKIEMADIRMRDMASWTQIRQEAQLLNAQCQSRYGYRYRGGWILMGTRGEIKISLRWPGTELQSNGTMTLSEVDQVPDSSSS